MPAQLPRRSLARCASTPAAPAEPATAVAAATTTLRAAQEIAAQAAATTTAAARVNQVSVEFQLFFFLAPFFPLYFAVPISLSSLAFASYIRFIACKALLVPLCKLCALKLCSCLRQRKARTKRDREKRQNKRGRERERGTGTHFKMHIAAGPFFIPLPFAMLVRLFCASFSLFCLSSLPCRSYCRILGCVFFPVRFQNYLLVLYSLVSLCVWHFPFTFPLQFGQQCLATSKQCENIAFQELLHVSHDRCPHPPLLGQVFGSILYVNRNGESCRDTSVLDSRNINSHFFCVYVTFNSI